MSDSPSTLNDTFRWAAAKDNKELGTKFFLFHQEEGRVGLRGSAEKRKILETVLEGDASVANSTMRITADLSLAKQRGVPQTKMLRSQPEQRYILLKKYEGFVTARDEESFSARLFENNTDYPVLEAEFDLEELSETDRELAVQGASLVWTIGYAYDGSTRKRESLIYLRRLPAWSSKELEKSRSKAEDLTSGISWE